MKHTPVLLQETLDALQVKGDEKYIDATFGAGGHAYAIAERGGEVLALDYDETTVKSYQDEAKKRGITLIHANYANIETCAKKYKFAPCEGILFDLGLSMEQISGSDRGFSYKQETALLDMRISRELIKSASDIITNYSEDELYETLVQGAEELNSRAIVQSIVRSRRVKPIKTILDLNMAVENGITVRGLQLEKVLRRVYQALFIEVNSEFQNLKAGLQGALRCIKQTGKIVVISFHSGHERIVKRFAKENNLITKVIRKKAHLSYRFERSATIRVLTYT